MVLPYSFSSNGKTMASFAFFSARNFCFLSFSIWLSTVGRKHSVPCSISRSMRSGFIRFVRQSTTMKLVSIQRTAFSAMVSGSSSSRIAPSLFSHSSCLSPWISIDNRTFSIRWLVGFLKCATSDSQSDSHRCRIVLELTSCHSRRSGRSPLQSAIIARNRSPISVPLNIPCASPCKVARQTRLSVKDLQAHTWHPALSLDVMSGSTSRIINAFCVRCGCSLPSG